MVMLLLLVDGCLDSVGTRLNLQVGKHFAGPQASTRIEKIYCE